MPPIPNQHEEAYLSLTRDLKELDLQDSAEPCDLVLIGDHAFPIAMNSKGQVLMAASFYGQGRIVVLGHEAYLDSFPKVVENAVTWLRGDGSNPSVGVHKNVKAVADNLKKSGIKAEVVGGFSDKQGAGVYVTDACSVGADPKDLVTFLRKGGGVLIAGQAWNWASQHRKDNTLHQFDGNKVAGVAGIYFSDHKAEREKLPVYPQIPSSWMAAALGRDFEDDLLFLLQGVSNFNCAGGVVFSDILVHGPLAFPIACNSNKKVFLAGGYYGQGRVIVISHEGLLRNQDWAPFWKNALLWLDEGRNGVVGIQGNRGRNILAQSGLKCAKTNFKEGLSVFVSGPNIGNPEQILKFVAEGGGLLVGGHAWWWAQSHSKHHVMKDFSGNQVLNKMGLSLLGSTLRGGPHKAPNPRNHLQETYHFRHMMHRFASHVNTGDKLTPHEQNCLPSLARHCGIYLSMKTFDCPDYCQVVAILTDILMNSHMQPVSGRCPAKTSKDHLLLSLSTDLYNTCPNQDQILQCVIGKNPPLPVVSNYKVTVNADSPAPHWISTGLYLSPGMMTYIAVPPELVQKQWKVQIGCQTDTLKGKVMKRAPNVIQVFNINKEMIQVSNLWGGLIYLVAPKDAKVKGAEVTVQMAVPAPYYKYGVTTAQQWAVLRTAPSPWAELEFDNVILTVPSHAVRKLEHPEELAVMWNDIMKAVADLAAKPHKFRRKERFVTEVQISHGWMHAGYPIMAHNATAANLLNVKKAKTKGMWGAIHELGHNQQRGCWEFPPHTTEGTCNLWSLYVHEKVLGVDRSKAHKGTHPAARKNHMETYVSSGRDLSKWSVWTALETYLQLQEKFGWDGLTKVYGAYHKMKDFPKGEAPKMNLYCETFSQTVGMNLCGFFRAWGWPIKPATEQKVSHLPSWNDHPMAQYA